MPSRPASARANCVKRGASKIRVAYCIDSFAVGGTELNAVRTAEALSPDDVELRVFHLSAEGPLRARYEALQLPLVQTPIPNLYSLETARQGMAFARQVRNWNADIVHTHDLYTNIFFASWARLATDSKVLASRRWWYDAPRPGLVPLNRWCNRFAHRILANSPRIATMLVDEENVPKRKVLVIPNFLAPAAFERPNAGQICEQRSLWGIPTDAFLVGIVARLARVKNHDLLLRAVARTAPNIHVAIVGDGPMRASIEQLASDMGIRTRVHLTGETVSQINLHHFFDLSVLCSTSEGFPNSIIEAMAAERPVIATPVGGVLDVIEDGRTGLLTALNDPPALAHAISSLQDSPASRARLGSAGRAFVEEMFSQYSVIQKLTAGYRSMATGRLA